MNDVPEEKRDATQKERPEERPKRKPPLNIRGSLDDVLRAAMNNAKPKKQGAEAD